RLRARAARGGRRARFPPIARARLRARGGDPPMTRLETAAVLLIAVASQVGCRSDARVRGYEYMPDMARSIPYDSFAANPVTRDGKTLQAPPPGTIARG